jgi:hypothetical protein
MMVQVVVLAVVLVVAIAVVALIFGRALGARSSPVPPSVKPRPMIDPRPLPRAHEPLVAPVENKGEAWLAIGGGGPVSARQLAIVMAKLPVGTMFLGVEADPVNGEHARKFGFGHWSFPAPNVEKYPNGARIWVAWTSESEASVSWPLYDE